MLSAEELVGPKLAVDHLASDLRLLLQGVSQWREAFLSHKQAGRQSLQKEGETSAGTLAFLEDLTDRVLLLEGDLGRISGMADQEARRLSGMVDRLVDELKHTLMLPFDHLLKIMPATVRDVARAQDKKVVLTQEGGQIEIDRRILEELKDPLIHLLRNSVDHGIETPEERRAAGKPETGQMGLSITPLDEGKVEIRLWDDGKGIDAEAVKAAAVKKGFIDQKTADGLDERSARELIFLSEMTTRPMITALSGRGLGLAIVREKVEALGGHLVLESQPGQGTTFRMILPVTQATFRGIVVQGLGPDPCAAHPCGAAHGPCPTPRDCVRRGPAGRAGGGAAHPLSPAFGDSGAAAIPGPQGRAPADRRGGGPGAVRRLWRG